MLANMQSANLYTKVLTFTIFYFIIINSLLQNIISESFISLSRIIVLLCLALSMVLNVLFFQNLSAKIYLFFSFIFACLLFLLKETQFSILILFAMYCLIIEPLNVIKSYFRGILYGLIFIVLLSLVGLIPIKLNNLWVFGFSNPNIIGFLLTVEILSYFVLRWGKISLFDYLLLIIIIVFEKLFLSDDTATIILTFFLLTCLMTKKKKLFHLIGNLTVITPVLLFCLSWFFAKFYDKFLWISKLSHYLTDRLEIWSDYLNIYGVHLLPQKITIFFATNFQKDFFGGSLSNLYAGFDTSYLYILLSEGILLSIFLLIVLTRYAYKIKNNPAFVCYSLSLFIYGFTETAVLSPLGYYQNALIVIGLASFFNSKYLNTIYLKKS